MDVNEDTDIHFYFHPKEDSLDSPKLLGPEEEKKKVTQLTTLARGLKDTLESTGLRKWEIVIEGYLEASSGLLPGGKAGFKATLRLSNA